MTTERFRLLAAVIAAHPNGRVVGRTRLQKIVKLLQRLGLPTDYGYMLHFYGPYSEGLQAEVGLLEMMDLVEEKLQGGKDGPQYYVIIAKPGAELEEVNRKYKGAIRTMHDAETEVLEIAATYDAFGEIGMPHEQALEAVRRKKAKICTDQRVQEALELLRELGFSKT